jgi:hypothetical protein
MTATHVALRSTRARGSFTSAASLVLFLSLGTGCVGWNKHYSSGMASDTATTPIRVTLRDRSQHLLLDAVVTPDSVTGIERGAGFRRAIARSDVEQIHRRGFQGDRTLGLVGGIWLGFGILGMLVFGGG